MQRRQDRNRNLKEEARPFKPGAHKYRRQEAAACRDREREAAMVAETCKKEQASD